MSAARTITIGALNGAFSSFSLNSSVISSPEEMEALIKESANFFLASPLISMYFQGLNQAWSGALRAPL